MTNALTIRVFSLLAATLGLVACLPEAGAPPCEAGERYCVTRSDGSCEAGSKPRLVETRNWGADVRLQREEDGVLMCCPEGESDTTCRRRLYATEPVPTFIYETGASVDLASLNDPRSGIFILRLEGGAELEVDGAKEGIFEQVSSEALGALPALPVPPTTVFAVTLPPADQREAVVRLPSSSATRRIFSLELSGTCRASATSGAEEPESRCVAITWSGSDNNYFDEKATYPAPLADACEMFSDDIGDYSRECSAADTVLLPNQLGLCRETQCAWQEISPTDYQVSGGSVVIESPTFGLYAILEG